LIDTSTTTTCNNGSCWTSTDIAASSTIIGICQFLNASASGTTIISARSKTSTNASIANLTTKNITNISRSTTIKWITGKIQCTRSSKNKTGIKTTGICIVLGKLIDKPKIIKESTDARYGSHNENQNGQNDDKPFPPQHRLKESPLLN
jgi:hypothetical protein